MKLASLLLIPVLFVCCVSPCLAQQSEAALDYGKIQVEIMPYLIIPGMSGDVTVRGTTQSINPSPGDIFGKLQFGFMGRTNVTYNRWFVGTDTVYMGLGGANDLVDAGFDQWIGEALAGYRVSKRFTILGGARYNSLSANLKFKGPLATNIRGAHVWWDPFFGAVGSIPLGKKVSFSTRFDVGGFGSGSNIAINAEPLLNYRLSKRLTGVAGWKFFYEDYVNSERQFNWDVLTQGAILGLKMSW